MRPGGVAWLAGSMVLDIFCFMGFFYFMGFFWYVTRPK